MRSVNLDKDRTIGEKGSWAELRRRTIILDEVLLAALAHEVLILGLVDIVVDITIVDNLRAMIDECRHHPSATRAHPVGMDQCSESQFARQRAAPGTAQCDVHHSSSSQRDAQAHSASRLARSAASHGLRRRSTLCGASASLASATAEGRGRTERARAVNLGGVGSFQRGGRPGVERDGRGAGGGYSLPSARLAEQ